MSPKRRTAAADDQPLDLETVGQSRRQRRKSAKRLATLKRTQLAKNTHSETGTAPEDIRFAAGRDLADDPWRNRHNLRDALGRFMVSALVLTLTIWISPGITLGNWWVVPLTALWGTILLAVLRPVMIRLAVPFGWFGAAMVAFFGNFVVLYVAFGLSPSLESAGWFEVFIASWIYSAIMAAAQWLMASDDDDVFLVQALRHSTRGGSWGSRLADDDVSAIKEGRDPKSGVIFVQLDGMPAPVLDWAVKSGNLPTLARWIRSGQYSWTEWRSRVPATTPVAQAGLLHGTSHNMPAFRWYEKDSGRLLVANHPPDAAEIESRITNGRGLLADGGVSISNLFSGDATTRLLVMSGMDKVRKGLGSSTSYSSFFANPAAFSRTLVMTIGEMIKEKYQGRTQVRRNIVPRIHRKGSYVALRGLTNVLLRQLNTSLVIESMMQGAKSVYVDFVDYDEIAHHAGVQRPEALRALEGLDRVLAQLERVARYAPRPYEFVCLSDHGQSQGATFKQRYGRSLEDVIRALMGVDAGAVAASTGAVEDWGPVNTFLSQLQQQGSVTGGLTRRAMRHRTDEAGAVSLGPLEGEQKSAAADAAGDRPELVVVGSGNLGGVWFPREPGHLSLQAIEDRWPGLATGLAKHPGVSFIVVQTDTDGPVAIGAHGVHRLRTNEVDGVDPLAPFGPDIREDMLRVSTFDNAPDIYLNSMYDPMTDEVAAFEELVGCHGGAGGWQNRAILVYPSSFELNPELSDPRGRLLSAEAVHQQMVEWLELLGHRKELRGAPDVEIPS
ncbi:MAG: phage holin family protein [Actinobacteria bacterium]|nr:phage holin family protein [Actinomycetota bacterium]